MKHGSLFSGGGGFDLAAEQLGWTNIFHVEKDAFCRRVLDYYWPLADSYADIKYFNATKYRGQIDVLTGGFPCQPFSTAGQRRGTEDDRYLWPEMLRVIRESKPRWIVGENVYGFVNWNGGLVFKQVLSDLEAEGYRTQAFLLPAASVNAPHQRYRVWIVAFDEGNLSGRFAQAYTNACRNGRSCLRFGRTVKEGRKRRQCKQFNSLYKIELDEAYSYASCNGCHRLHREYGQLPGEGGQYAQHYPEPLGSHAANANRTRLEMCADTGRSGQDRKSIGQQLARSYELPAWSDWPTQSPLRGGDDGLPTRLDDIAIPKWCAESIKMFGNAVVPEVVMQLFRSIELYEQLHG